MLRIDPPDKERRMRLAIQGRVLFGALAIVAVALLAAGAARSEEPKCAKCVKVEEISVPILAKLPYVGRLFRTVGIAPECDHEFERIGIDFESAQCPACPLSAGRAVFFAPAEETCGENACAATGKCGAIANCVAAKCCADTKCCAAECCQKEACVATGEEKSELWQHVAELTAENAAMDTMLQAHEEILEAREKMFETVTELMVDKAKLEARLEMVEHRDGLLKELVELQAENARLKAQAEVAQQKEELLKAQFTTALENEQLKQRVAELERQTGADYKPVLAEKEVKARKNR
jgi:hypothetical protein